jgi:hypothetical protein
MPIRARDQIEALFGHLVAAGQVVFMRFQRVDDGFELGGREDAFVHQAKGQPGDR